MKLTLLIAFLGIWLMGPLWGHKGSTVNYTDSANHNNEGHSRELKVLTFNMAALAPFGKLTKPQTVKRVEELCRQLRSSDYDVILLQEVWTVGYRRRLKKCGFPFVYSDEKLPGLITKKRQGEEMSSSLKLIAKMAAVFLPRKYGFDKGLMILSRFPLSETKSIRFDLNGISERAFLDGEFPVNKGALFAKILHPKLGEVLLVNTHLVSFYPDYNYDTQRSNQIREIVSAIEEINPKNVILGGDFNMSPPGPNGQERRGQSDLLWRRIRHTLLDSFVEANLPYEEMTTFPNRDGREGPTAGVLDHLFSRGELDPISSEVVFKEKISCGGESCFPSDHYGVSTTYSISKRHPAIVTHN